MRVRDESAKPRLAARKKSEERDRNEILQHTRQDGRRFNRLDPPKILANQWQEGGRQDEYERPGWSLERRERGTCGLSGFPASKQKRTAGLKPAVL